MAIPVFAFFSFFLIHRRICSAPKLLSVAEFESAASIRLLFATMCHVLAFDSLFDDSFSFYSLSTGEINGQKYIWSQTE